MRYYDHISAGYDELHKEEQLRKIEIILSRLLKETLVEGALLDVGCGTGFSLDMLAQATGKKVQGVEPSKGMLEQYKGKENITQAGAEELPYPDQHFCAVVSITAIQNFSDIPDGVAEIERVAKNDAPIIISCLKKSSKLKDISVTLADTFEVEEIIEEEKDLIYFCRKKKRLNISDA